MELDWLKDPVASAERGENPTVIGRMKAGFAVIGIAQFLPGYCLLLASPKVARLEDMERAARSRFLEDMGLLGEAVAQVCAPRRMNYSIYGNTDGYVHAHVVPRYDWEPAERITRPIWEYGPAMWSDPAHRFDEARHGELKRSIGEALLRIAGT